LSEVIASDHPLNALRHQLHLHGLCEEIVLDPFSETEVAQYLDQRTPSMANDESFVRALHERTDGVPLFVASVTSDVTSRSALSGIATAALLANAPVPENLSAIIDQYVAKLDKEKRVLLSAAAVCGDEFRIDTLARVLERDDLWIADLCEQLLREQLWLAHVRRMKLILARAHIPSPRSFQGGSLRALGAIRPCRASPQGRHGARTERSISLGVAAAELAMHFDRGRAPMAGTALLRRGSASCATAR
jgi:hypothetical protein